MRFADFWRNAHLLGLLARSVTWANRPTSPAVGTRIRLTDYGNREMYWNGTLWLPIGPAVFAQSAVPASVTGTTTETTLATIIIPGGMMGPNGTLRITSLWSVTNNANAKVAVGKIASNSTNVFSSSLTTSATIEIQKSVRNRNSLSSQVYHNSAAVGSGSGVAVQTMALDTSVDQQLLLRGLLANTGDTITLEGYTVEVLPS